MGTRRPVGTLGGFPAKADVAEGWTFTEGSSPSTCVMSLRPQDAEKLLANNEVPVTLYLKLDTRVQQVNNLYVLHQLPSSNPKRAHVLVADHRWMWANRNIERDYNVRREIGSIRFVDGLTDETAINNPQITYWEWSLKSGATVGTFDTWKASDIIADILEDIFGLMKTKPTVSYFPLGGKTESDSTAIQNLSFSGDGGDAAINRILSVVPGLGIKLDENGNVVVYRKDIGGPQEIADIGLGAISESRGVMVKVNNRLLRPAKINVRTEREIELRIDSNESDSSGTQAQQNPLDLYMVNVVPIPVPSMIINVDGVDKLMYQGNWVTMDQFIAGVNRLALDDFVLSKQMIREAMVPLGTDLFARMSQMGINSPRLPMVAIAAAIQNNFRTTYQIPRFWISKIKSLRAYRLSTINEATGGRSPAVCYSNYAIKSSLRGRLNKSIDDQFVFMNMRGFPFDAKLFPQVGTAAVEKVSIAPCTVKIVDADQGIIRLEFVVDPYENQAAVIPSMLKNPPNANLLQNSNAWTVDSVVEELANGEHPELTPSDRKAVILSAVPAAPNDSRRLHKIVITPDMVNARFNIDVGECVGPEMDIFIGPNVITCKIAWRDRAITEIKKCFGYPRFSNEPNLAGLILNDPNPGGSALNKAASLTDTALAYAAQIYATLTDRIHGEQAGDFNPDVTLGGWEESVQHVIEPNGKMLTVVKFIPRLPRISIQEYMNSNMRNAIFKVAQPPGAV